MRSFLANLLFAQTGIGEDVVEEEPVKDFVYYLDAANEWLKNLNFEQTIRDPIFWLISIVLMAFALFRGWKGFMICYVIGIAMWGVVHHTVLKDKTAAAQSTQSVMVFAVLTVGVAGLAIYLLLIKD